MTAPAEHEWKPRRWYSRQRLVSMLYCDGLSAKQVALVLAIPHPRVKDDLRIIRRAYISKGRACRGRIAFRRCLVEDGYLSEGAGRT